MAAAVRVQIRGPVTDRIPLSEDGYACGPATCRCVHGVEWPEGGVDASGAVVCCQPCLAAFRESWDGKPVPWHIEGDLDPEKLNPRLRELFTEAGVFDG